MRYERTIAITRRHEALLGLIARGRYSCPQLAKELGVSLPTVSRDLVFLRDQGYAIKAVRRGSGWAYELTGPPEPRRGRRKQT